jgi:Bax protein
MAAELRARILSVFSLMAIAGAVAGLYTLALGGAGSPLVLAVRGAPTSTAPLALLAADETASAHRLEIAFSRLGYRLDAVGQGGAEVPPVFLSTVPTDMSELTDPDTRKAVFLRVMLPLVLAVNDEILAERRRLMEIVELRQRGSLPSAADEAWLAALAERYGADARAELHLLLRRVDAVPPSLALAQAAVESGWGTSRLVRRDNNLFGHTDSEGGLRAFGNLHEAVRAYAHNLNTFRAYEKLRRSRATARSRGAFPDGNILAVELSSYSERGRAYIDDIRSVIRVNGLMQLDHARLGRGFRGRSA